LQLLQQLFRASSWAQQQSDLEHQMELAPDCKHTNDTVAQLLVGASTMTYNPHYQFFVSQNTTDRQLCYSLCQIRSLAPNPAHESGVKILWKAIKCIFC
jgi:hypothetical protein